MSGDRVTWTPTASELEQLTRAGTRLSWRLVGLPVLLIMVVLGSLIGTLRGWAPLGFVLLLVIGLLASGWSWFRGGRAAAREFATSYPVGTEVSAEVDDSRLVLHTATGDVDLPWLRLRRPRPGPDLLAVRDLVGGKWLMIPRQLFPDPWLDRIGPRPGTPSAPS
ncbi:MULTISPECIES: hypothetical protein [unclassified Nocardioides]|jgi:F0F1-type ATP synthase assembly protein I|uniref:hypothetical protein n=1 Tax=unclassified Nocardioides TaxID=2615069 RepID=UPI0007027525|nr:MULTISPECIES: hypothetical protein [unclassified Nocardioides]KRC52755.1 hypothetical protein ASE19_10065 [Nocardioides sp. Root79]KRC72286.1 hypothetical protein ASE20_06600 [Nocardioides sp. Root240]